MLENPLILLMIGALAVLLFGERLPEVARTVGRGLMEFKKGVHGIQQDIQGAIDSATTSTGSSASVRYEEPSEDREEATAPKFEPPPSP